MKKPTIPALVAAAAGVSALAFAQTPPPADTLLSPEVRADILIQSRRTGDGRSCQRKSSSTRYPVPHGQGYVPDSLTNAGQANLILDNLIAAGEAKPMILVMPAGDTDTALPGAKAFGHAGG